MEFTGQLKSRGSPSRLDLEKKSIQRIIEASNMSFQIYGQPLIITDSGGKDSLVNRILTQRAGIPFELQHNHTTADAPETVYYVRQQFKKLEERGISCSINMPFYKQIPVTMWSLIPMKRIPPCRTQRYCCEILKEQGGRNRFITTGVRWSESTKRKNSRGIYETYTKNINHKVILNNDNDDKRKLFERCELKAKHICNPIVDWADRDIWDYIRSEHLEYNPLYDEGFYRIGCIGCPMAGKGQYGEFARFPTYERAYRQAFQRMLEVIWKAGKVTKWKNSDDVFRWWMEDKNVDGQMSMFLNEDGGLENEW